MQPSFEDELQKLKDAWTVEMAMSEHYRERQREHEAWIKANEAAIALHKQWLLEHEAVMLRIDERLDRITALLEGKIRGENGNQ